MVKVKCIICKKSYEVKPYRIKAGARFCSSKCYGIYRMENFSGKNHNHWKGGVVYQHGYRFIHKPDHPNSTHTGYVAEHRLVAEMTIGRYLDRKKEVVHHINGIKTDNRPENLTVMLRSDHILEHIENLVKTSRQARGILT